MSKLRILFLTACPTDRARPNVEREYHHIDDALARSSQGARFDLRFVPAARRDDVWRIMHRDKPDVIHFSGHGESDELIFLDGDDRAEPLSAAQFGQMLALLPPSQRPRLAVFSACYSEPHAAAAVETVDCAVGMVSTIRDSAAFRFSAGFYLALGLGNSVEVAVKNARNEMPRDTAGLPTLHVREGITAASVKLLTEGPVGQFPADLDIDRLAEMECFLSMLARTGEDAPRLLLVTAERNMGKSRLIERMAEAPSEALRIKLDLNRASLGPTGVIGRIAELLDVRLETSLTAADADRDLANLSTSLTAERYSELAAATTELLAHADAKADESGFPIALLLDGFDQPAGELAAWIERTWIPGVLASRNVVCVLSGREAPDVATHLHLVRRHRLGNFGIDDVRQAMQALQLDVSAGQDRVFWVATEGQPFVTVSKLMKLWEYTVVTP